MIDGRFEALCFKKYFASGIKLIACRSSLILPLLSIPLSTRLLQWSISPNHPVHNFSPSPPLIYFHGITTSYNFLPHLHRMHTLQFIAVYRTNLKSSISVSHLSSFFSNPRPLSSNNFNVNFNRKTHQIQFNCPIHRNVHIQFKMFFFFKILSITSFTAPPTLFLCASLICSK